MESDELPLEALLARYEEGVKLVEICRARLASADARIQQLERAATGESKLQPLNSDGGDRRQ